MIWLCCLTIALSFLLSTHVTADDWASFTNMESDKTSLEQAQDKTFDANNEFIASGWVKNWQEDKDYYRIAVVLAEEDLPSKIEVVVENGQVKMTLGPKVEFIRFPNDANLAQMTHRVSEDKIIIEVPKNKLKSII